MQPGDEVVLFNGQGGEWVAEIEQMSRAATHVRVRHYTACSRELPGAVTLAIGMPANERMDWLVEKAAELGATAIQPLDCQRSVLRLSGPRATKRVAHWQAIAIAACEQSGRTAVPVIHPIQPASDWLGAQASTAQNGSQFVLSLRDSIGLSQALPAEGNLPQACFLSGPEGGLTDDEEDAALAAGFHAVSLGPRTLRADTAPITALAIFGSRFAAAR
jgi:16S rRNA (uracil1498-N3)-methyltransferase